MDIAIHLVVQEKKSMIYWDSCKSTSSFRVTKLLCILFVDSLFQIVESTGELAARLGFDNVARHDSCSALIKVKKYPIQCEEKRSFFSLDFIR